jgi:hypothetical protein
MERFWVDTKTSFSVINFFGVYFNSTPLSFQPIKLLSFLLDFLYKSCAFL